MRLPLLPAVLAAASTSGMAQVLEIPAMTAEASVLNMSAVLPAGTGTPPGQVTTSLAALVAAGTNGGAPIAAIALTPGTAASGIYNTNPQMGRALALNTSGALTLLHPVTLDPATVPLAVYGAFDARIDLSVPSTEFGLAVGDWLGGMVLEFRSRTSNDLVAAYTTTPYTTPNAKFFRAPAAFDRIVIRADNPSGNWVIPQLHLQTGPAWEAFGTGCPGTTGIPVLGVITPPRINSTLQLSMSNMPATGGVWVMCLGSSTVNGPLGPLPNSLEVLGAPGCLLFCSVDLYSFGIHTNGTAQYDFFIPNNPLLIGITAANQAMVSDPTVNALGAVMTNAGAGTVR